MRKYCLVCFVALIVALPCKAQPQFALNVTDATGNNYKTPASYFLTPNPAAPLYPWSNTDYYQIWERLDSICSGGLFAPYTHYRWRNTDLYQIYQKLDSCFTSGGGGVVCGSANFVLMSDGTDGVCSQIYDNGVDGIGIGTTSPDIGLDIQSSDPNGANIWLNCTSGTGKEYRIVSTGVGNTEGAGMFGVTNVTDDPGGYVFRIDDVGTTRIGSSSSNLTINPGGGTATFLNISQISIPAFAGTGERVVFANSSGDLGVGFVASQVIGTSDLINQMSAIPAEPLAGINYTGFYQVNWTADIKTAASVSSVLGGTAGFQITYTDGNDLSTKVSPAASAANSFIQTSAANTTGTMISGSISCYASGGTTIFYDFDYTSTGGTSMVYDIHVVVVKMF